MKKKWFWVCLLCIAWGIDATHASGEEAEEISVMSYNIHHGEGIDGRLDLARIAEVIRSVSPDIVALQEVDRNVKRTGNVDQLAELARLTGMKSAFGANIELQGGEYGNAVLSRFPFVRSENRRLPNFNDGEQRGVLVVDVNVPGWERPLRVLATHFDHRRDERERIASAKFVRQMLEGNSEQPMILAGDLNATPDSETLKIVQADWQRSNREPMPTIPVDTPQRQIDYVLFRPESRWRRISTEVLDAAIASDHRPLVARLKLMVGER
jgi:endonuclease/exonuclease/phosphatase family metal-dependent hydrolase